MGTLRDLLHSAHVLESDLRDAGLFTAAAKMYDVIEAIRNREAYDREGEEHGST